MGFVGGLGVDGDEGDWHLLSVYYASVTLCSFLNICHLIFSQQPHKVHITFIIFGVWNQIYLVNDDVYFP